MSNRMNRDGSPGGGGQPDLSHKSPKLDTPQPASAARIADASISLQGGAADDLKNPPYAFGLVETEGSIRYAFQTSTDLWIVRALALGEREATIYGGEQAGECDGLVGIYTDVGAFPYVNFQSWWYSGSLSQTVNTQLAAVDGSWHETLVITDKTGKHRGICYAVECWSNVAKLWASGILKIRYRFRGSRVKNTTTGVTAYTVNPWWQARYWALDPAGMLLKPSRINEASFQAAAASSPSGSYESHMLLTGNTRDCRKQFALLGAGWLVYAGGNQLTAIADRGTDPVVATYDDTHFSKAKTIEIGPSADPDQMVNKVSIEYTDASTDIWKLITVSLSTAGLLAGTETEVPATFKFPQLHALSAVQLMLGYLLYSYQETRLKGNWLANAGGPRLIGDVVTQSVPARGISDNFRVAIRDKQPNGTFDVELQLIDARKWAGATSTPASRIGSTLQDPYSPPDIALGTITWVEDLFVDQSGVLRPRILLSWTNPTYGFLDGVEAYVAINGGTRRSLPGDIVSPALINDAMEVGASYAITLVVRSSGGARSAGTTITRTITGKTAPPADVPGLTGGANGSQAFLWWQSSSDRDIVFYEIRRGLPSDTWSTAVYAGQTKVLHWTDAPPYGTQYRYFVKAIDSSGRYSANAATFDIVMNAVGALVSETSSYLGGFSAADFTRILVPPGASSIGGLWRGSGNLFVSETRRIDGIAIVRAWLCRTDVGRVAAEAERAAAGYTLAQWRTLIDDPRRGGAPLWAPLPANAQGEIYGHAFFGMQRLAEHRIRLLSVKHAGLDTPQNVAIAQPWFGLSLTAKNYGNVFLTPPDNAVYYAGLRLSSNSPYYQQIVSDDGSGNLIGDSVETKPYTFAKGTATTDGSGLVTITHGYAPAGGAGGSRWLSATVIVAGSVNRVVIVDNINVAATTVRFKSYDDSGAAAASVTFAYQLIDNTGTTANFTW